MKLRLCRHNRWSEQLQGSVGEHPNLEIKVKDCLKQCKICRKQPLARIKKQMVTSETLEGVIGQLNEIINEKMD